VPWASKRQRAGHQAPKRHQAVCGCWHALDTLARYYCVRTYLVSIRNHGIPPIDTMRAALAGRHWLPIPVSALRQSGEWTRVSKASLKRNGLEVDPPRAAGIRHPGGDRDDYRSPREAPAALL
jgi:hypothetical protein